MNGDAGDVNELDRIDIRNSSIIYVDKSILQNLFSFYYPLYVYKHATELRF